MKKYLLVVFCVALLFIVTGCGNKNSVTCSGKMDGNEAEVIAEFDGNDKLTTITATQDLGSKESADQYCTLYSSMLPADSGISVSCSGSKVTIKGFEKMMDDEEDSMVGMTKEQFKQAMEADSEGQVTCK